MKKILMIIKTDGLDYDDRLRKECISLKSIGENVKIIALVASNLKSKGKTEYDVEFKTISIFSRKIFPQKKFLFFKTFEMYLKFFWNIIINKPQIVWLHNLEMIGLVPFVAFLRKIRFIKKLIWDQHELIEGENISTNIFSKLYKPNIKKCDYVIHANKERANYLVERFKIKLNNFIVLDNYIDEFFFKLPKAKLPIELINWLNNSKYILAQGGASRGRNFFQLVDAIMQIEDFKLVVIGPYQVDKWDIMEKKYKNILKEKIFFTGMVPQLEMVKYIDNAYASIVLYSQEVGMNFKLCAPNRLYQAISRGIPVIVGNNPPMKSILEKTKSGVVLSDDGQNMINIINGIKYLQKNYSKYKENSLKTRKLFLWNTQKDKIQSILS